MRAFVLYVTSALGLLLAIAAQAQTPSVTATCKDGTSYAGTTKSGACSGHGGVKAWTTATTSSGATAATPAPAATPATTSAATPTVTATCKDGSAFSGTKKSGACAGHGGVKTWGTATSGGAKPAGAAVAPASTSTSAVKPPAAGGGPGQVWVNTSTKVYHCPGDKSYGNTVAGSYMSQSDAMAKGYRAAAGKACS